MTFLAPWAAWFLAGIPLIVLLYLLKLKRRPVPVSTLMFWQKVLQESRRRALFQRLRNFLSLLLHLLIFLLILGALAKPTFDRFVHAASSTVVIVDNRARMQAIEEGGASRFDLARRAASAQARQASPQRQIALLVAEAAPVVAVPFTGDEKPLTAALDSLIATDAAGDLAVAVRLAADLLASRSGERRIVLITDPASAAKIAAPGVELSVLPVGGPRDNVAIRRFATRPLLNSPQTSEILLEVRNFGRASVTGNVELALDGRRLDVKPFTIEPGGQKLEIFPSVPRPLGNGRGWLTARLDTADALAVDNAAYAILPAPKPLRLLLVSKGQWFLEKLLAADPQLSFELLAPETFQPAMAEKFDAVIFDNFVPPKLNLASARGNFLFVNASPFTVPGGPVEQPIITEIEAADPILRLVRLQNVTIVRASRTQLPAAEDGWSFHAPLRSFEHPLLIAGMRRGQRIAALTFDVAESDLPLRVAFPLLIANTVQWLGGAPPVAGRSVQAGETIALAPGETLWREPQRDPGSRVEPPPDQLTSGAFQPLHAGYYRAKDAASSSWIAVNTFSEAESDLRETNGVAATADLPRVPALMVFGGWPPWHYLALAALALSAFEWWLFHRRRTE